MMKAIIKESFFARHSISKIDDKIDLLGSAVS
jgi:hypothetical protein